MEVKFNLPDSVIDWLEIVGNSDKQSEYLTNLVNRDIRQRSQEFHNYLKEKFDNDTGTV